MVSKLPSWNMAHLHEKISGCSCSSRTFRVLDWPHDCSDRGVDEIIRWVTTEVWQYFYNNIYVKLANDFNPTCLCTTFARKKSFPIEHMKLKGPSYPIASWLDFFVFHIFLYFLLGDKRYIDCLRLQFVLKFIAS